MAPKLILLVDCSGSMSCAQQQTIDNLNKFISKQQEDSELKDTYVYYYAFNTEVIREKSAPLKDFTKFNLIDYKCDGGTALYDAIGKTMLKHSGEQDNVFVILTDGEENSSRIYSLTAIKHLLSNAQEVLKWKVLYLSENLDTKAQGKDLGIHDHLNIVTNGQKCVHALGTSCFSATANAGLKNNTRGFTFGASQVSNQYGN
jgi:hypothetical protein